MLLEYVRNRKGEKIGLVVAYDRWSIGYSLCKKGDKFNKELGLKIATGRAEVGTQTIPMTVQPLITKMISRANRYFK